MYEVSIVIPCFNEKDNIPDIVPKIVDLLREASINGEIIIVNDGSTDGTFNLIEALSKQYNNVSGVNHETNLGIANAWYTGVRNSRGRYVTTIDADSQYDPKCIKELYQVITKDNCDLVQGRRGDYKDKDMLRKFLSRALSHFLNLMFFTRIDDIKSGFIIVKKEVFADILEERNKFCRFQHFFILCALKKGYCLKQIPVAFYPRIKGRSFITNPIFFSLKILLELPRALWEYGIISRLLSKGKR
ncbi:MAG: glycosyltransferase family 2 protein [Candidatus Omnitrophota bacterium]|nr:glycosyltransferase family 2 protein [Candidatus Omnitrophota bacterium]MBU1928380.1 glycosyltransferase family 2 protein [Candidatus Omnitrophota bacterium]MBU2034554.1 glycosyltransferase family 2 protein [Candidatus Omnitrophota bacterium]MBU2222251.1 glycosyltransferase family 2 protein [Candidatus Omnitrophota bacterium]MBU2258725.1 glycosyltransferase family 2 protein [Candidatus Omnitrophota bacterium]